MTNRLDERVLFAALNEAADFVLISDDSPAEAGGPILLYVNRSLLEATGYSEEEIVGNSYHRLLSPRNPPQLLASISRAIEAGEENHRELLVRRRDDTDFWVELVGRRFHDGSAHPYRLTIARDITLRRRSLYQVALLFAATEQSSDAIALFEPLDDTWQLTYENEEAYRVGASRLPDLLAQRPDLQQRLEESGDVHEYFAELDAAAAPALREFRARAIRNDAGIEAVVTIERRLGAEEQATGENYESRLLRVAGALTSLARAGSQAERVAMLRAILLDAFGAYTEMREGALPHSVQVDVAARRAAFALGNQGFNVRWEHQLESTSVTAMRFCIEAAIELEDLPAHRRGR